MKRNGFTLVELLAVIVILAVIALIATPTILGVIEKTKKGAAEQSALGYIDAIEKQVAMNEVYSNQIKIEDGIYDVPMDNVKVKGTMPTSGWIEIEKGIVIDYSMIINEYLVTKGESTVKSDSKSYLVVTNLLKEIKEKVTTETQEGVYFIDENGNLDYGNNILISLNKTEIKGNVSIYNDQVTDACFNYENQNYEYKENKMKIRNLPCLIQRYANLVINGDMAYNDNTNFNFGIYEDNLIIAKYNNKQLITNDYIPVDINKTYELGITLKSSNNEARSYIGFTEYDIDHKMIESKMYMYVPNTLTTLKEDLKDGDTIVYLNDLTNWLTSTDNEANKRGFIFWNYTDSTGYTYPELTYSRNSFLNVYEDSSVDKTNNTITLNKPWSGGTIKAGTKLSQSSNGAVFNYILAINKILPQEFTTYSYSGLTGENRTGNQNFTMFRPGTKYIRMGIFNNTNNILNTTTYIKNIYFKEIEI